MIQKQQGRTGRHRAERNEAESFFESVLARLVVNELCDMVPLYQAGWRIARGDRTAEYWPRTGRWRTVTGGDGRGFRQLCSYLRLPPQAVDAAIHAVPKPPQVQF